MANGYFPGKKPAKRSAIITPRTGQELQIAAMPRMGKTLRDSTPLRVGGSDLVEGVDRVMRTPADHKAAGVQIKGAPVSLRSDPPSPPPSSHVAPLKVARLYLRVSTDEQDLARQEALIEAARAAGFYVAGIYREKASGARADRPELLRMIADLQPGEAVVAERIDRLSRLPLPEAEQLVASIQAKGARLAIPGVVDLSELAAAAEGVPKIVLQAVQDMLLKLALQMAREDYEDRRERQRQGIDIAKAEGKYQGRPANRKRHAQIIAFRAAGHSIARTAELVGCSEAQVKRVWSARKVAPAAATTQGGHGTVEG